MIRIGLCAALTGAALVGLVLAFSASATTSASERSAAPSATSAVTNYLKYVKGKRGKANPKKSKIYIGWVNQQGGQVVIGGLATAGAELAVKYVNDQLGGVGGHPVALVECFVKSNEEEGTTCGQKLVNNKRINVIAIGRRRHGSPVVLLDGPRREAGRQRCRRHPDRRRAEERHRPLRRRGAHPRCRSARTRRTSSRPRPRRSSIRRRRASRRRHS